MKMCDDICNKKMGGVLPKEIEGNIITNVPLNVGINVSVKRRLLGEMSTIMFAKNYIVCDTGNKVVHWINVNRVKCIRERLVLDSNGNDLVEVLFEADGFRYVADNLDIIQFLTELHLAKEIGNE